MLTLLRVGKKGQSTIEYMLVVTAVVAAAIAFQGTFRADLAASWLDQSTQMKNMANRLGNIIP